MGRRTILLATTAGFGALYLAGTLALGTTPSPDESGQAAAAWFRTHGRHVRGWTWCLTLFAPVFATFAAAVRQRLPEPHRDVFFFGAIAFATETAVQSWLWAGAAWHATDLAPATARTLLDVASFWGPVLTGATATMLAPIVALAIDGSTVPRWLGAVCGLALAEQLIETVTIFGRAGFLAPGGAMNMYLGAGLVAAALLSLGVAFARNGNADLPAP